MKKILLLIGTLFMTTQLFADNVSFAARAGAAWKMNGSVQTNLSNDMTIVYGGKDIATQPGMSDFSTYA